MKLGLLDSLIIVLYSVLVAYMGYYFSKKNKSTEEYFVGGRSFSGFIIGMSLIGTSISSVTFIAYPADAFKGTWMRFIPVLAYPVAAIFAITVFIPFFRRNRFTSAYEYVEKRFSAGIRVYTASVCLLGQLFRVSIILYLLSLLMHEILGLDLNICVVLSGLFVGGYTIIGGIDAVIWTDVLQTIILFLGGIICLVIITIELPGGLGEIFSVAISDSKLGFGTIDNGSILPAQWGFSLSSKTVSMLFIVGFWQWMGGYTTEQNVVQRYCSSRSTKEARKAVIISVLSSLPIWGFYMFIGTALYVFFKRFPTTESTEIIEGARKAEQIMPFFIMNYLPVGVKGFIVVSAFAAAMSSIDSSINAISTIAITDLYKRHISKERDDKHYLKVAHLIAAGATVVMVTGALILIYSASTTVRDMLLVLNSIMSSGILGMYLLGFFTRRANSRAITIGLVLSVCFTIFMILSNAGLLPNILIVPLDMYYVGMIGNLLMMFVGYLISLLLPSKAIQNDLEGLTVWTTNKNKDNNNEI